MAADVDPIMGARDRARATMSARDADTPVTDVATGDQRELLARYVDAFERYDIASLVSLLHEEAVMTMPPFDFWLRGSAEMARFFVGPGSECRDSRLLATSANGCPAFGQYHPDGQGGRAPWALQVIEISGDKITGHHNFIGPQMFEAFGFPARLD